MTAYRTHDVLVLPSTYEGFGMVIIEAMSQRLPVVTTPVGCARTLVAHERTGLIVPPRDGEALAAALTRAVGDDALRTRLADAAFDAYLASEASTFMTGQTIVVDGGVTTAAT